MRAAMNKKFPTLSAPKTVFEGFFNVIQSSLSTENKKLTYDFVEIKGDAISVITLTKEGKFLVNREWRPATEETLLSTTGGLIHAYESPLEAAHRELLEETGYKSDNITTLSTVYPFPGITGQKITYLLAKDATKVQEPTLEEGEWIETELLTKQELLKEIQTSKLVDGVFLAGLFLAFQSLSN